MLTSISTAIMIVLSILVAPIVFFVIWLAGSVLKISGKLVAGVVGFGLKIVLVPIICLMALLAWLLIFIF